MNNRAARAILSPDRMIRFGGAMFPAVVGENGIAAFKLEGDHATPSGILPLRRLHYRADRLPPPRCAVPLEPITQNDGWCDDSKDPAYNRAISLPFGGRHERLWRDDGIYDIVGVLGWNDQPIVPGRGSAIFLHLTRPNRAPTEGCIALDLKHLLELLGAGVTEIEVIAP